MSPHPPIDPSPLLTATYRNSVLDLFVITTWRTLPTVLALWALVVAYHVLMVCLTHGNVSVAAIVLEITLFATIMFMAIVGATLVTSMAVSFLRRRAVGVTCTLEVNDHGLRETSVHARVEFPWAAVKQIRWILDRCVIRLVGGLMIIVPAREFESPVHADAFFAELQRRRAEHGGK